MTIEPVIQKIDNTWSCKIEILLIEYRISVCSKLRRFLIKIHLLAYTKEQHEYIVIIIIIIYKIGACLNCWSSRNAFAFFPRLMQR
jgi:hypothetical protein